MRISSKKKKKDLEYIKSSLFFREQQVVIKTLWSCSAQELSQTNKNIHNKHSTKEIANLLMMQQLNSMLRCQISKSKTEITMRNSSKNAYKFTISLLKILSSNRTNTFRKVHIFLQHNNNLISFINLKIYNLSHKFNLQDSQIKLSSHHHYLLYQHLHYLKNLIQTQFFQVY